MADIDQRFVFKDSSGGGVATVTPVSCNSFCSQESRVRPPEDKDPRKKIKET